MALLAPADREKSARRAPRRTTPDGPFNRFRAPERGSGEVSERSPVLLAFLTWVSETGTKDGRIPAARREEDPA